MFLLNRERLLLANHHLLLHVALICFVEFDGRLALPFVGVQLQLLNSFVSAGKLALELLLLVFYELQLEILVLRASGARLVLACRLPRLLPQLHVFLAHALNHYLLLKYLSAEVFQCASISMGCLFCVLEFQGFCAHAVQNICHYKSVNGGHETPPDHPHPRDFRLDPRELAW